MIKLAHELTSVDVPWPDSLVAVQSSNLDCWFNPTPRCIKHISQHKTCVKLDFIIWQCVEPDLDITAME